MRTLTFELITGYNMSQGEMLDKINAMIDEVRVNLSRLPGVKFSHSGISKCWDTDKTPEQFDQVRCRFWVTKKGRGTTWDAIMGEVNKTYGPYYEIY